VDALASARTDSENDATRRLKNELLVRMSEAARGVLVLAATNVPWALDPAVRRRFERRIHVPLPEAEARATLLPCTRALAPTPFLALTLPQP
jgi:vacuolar protein-sorting-associated protein 4